MMRRATIAGLLIAGAMGVLHAQGDMVVLFDVASVKVNRSGFPGGMSEIFPGGRFVETNQTLRHMVLDAYGMEDFRVFGGPAWATTDRFDVDGRAGYETSAQQLMLMMRALLTDRFKLVVRNESREMPAFALSRDEGRSAPRLRAASSDACVERAPNAPVAAGQLPSCGTLRAGPGRMSGRSVAMGQFIQFLTPRVGRFVVDRSGVGGKFDFDLEWTPDAADRAAVARLNGGAPADADPNVPEITTALREQLGLRLQPMTAPVDVLVIAGAERPTED